MLKITTKNLGAGGYWKVIDEKIDASVVKQLTPFSCVAAVGVMLLRHRGITMTQDAVIDIIGEVSTTEQLAEFLNRIDQIADGNGWYGGFVSVEDFEKIAVGGQFGAVLREGRPLGHLVLVSELADDFLIISDPWDGTTYMMAVDEFLKVWDGEIVFGWKLLR